jgi:C1A family cysteine protease
MAGRGSNGSGNSNGLSTRAVKRYGWVPDIPDARDYLYAAPVGVLADLPEKVDLRRKCPAIYDQGALGSCTANAIAGAFEFEQLKQDEAKDFMPSRLFIYFNERLMEGTVDSDSGAMLRDGIKSVAQVGVCSESLWPYAIARFRNRPTARCFKEAADHQAIVYRRVLPVQHQMQGCLASGTPFVFGFSVYESFESAAVARTGTVPMPRPTERVLGGHAMLAVGYDDASQRFLLRNSWGTGWGKQGYCTMPYAYLTDAQLAADFWAIDTVEA